MCLSCKETKSWSESGGPLVLWSNCWKLLLLFIYLFTFRVYRYNHSIYLVLIFPVCNIVIIDVHHDSFFFPHIFPKWLVSFLFFIFFLPKSSLIFVLAKINKYNYYLARRTTVPFLILIGTQAGNILRYYPAMRAIPKDISFRAGNTERYWPW